MNYKLSLMLSVFSLLVFHELVGQTNQETRSLEAFNALKVSNSIEAELVKGNKYMVEISASGIDLDRIETKINNRTLHVGINGSNFGPSSVKVKITYLQLDEISAGSGSKVFVKDILDSKKVEISASTASYIEVAVNAQSLILEAATNAKIIIDGTAENLDIEAYTNAEINGEKLETEDAEVKVNTAGKVWFKVNESLHGSAATAGKVYYSGDPGSVNVKTNLGGEFEKDI